MSDHAPQVPPSPPLTGKVLEKFKSAFSFFDLNGDGKIESSELSTVMHLLGLDPSDEQVTDLVSSVDSNEDGSVQFDEFLPLLGRLLSRAMKSSSDLIQTKNMRQDKMKTLVNFLQEHRTPAKSTIGKKISEVALIVVVAEEIQPVLDKYKPQQDPHLQKEFMNLAYVYRCWVAKEGQQQQPQNNNNNNNQQEGEKGEGYNLTVLQVAKSPLYNRHYSGYTQSAAIAALAAKVINPDLIVSFGTAGGNVDKVKVTDCVLATGCVFVDRTRTSSKSSYDWGVFGGPTLNTEKLSEHLGVKTGIIGSQISYQVNDVQTTLMNVVGILGLDMEAASEAEILHQTGTNFIALKVISNGIYPGNGSKMEEEYIEHKAQVSAKGIQVLGKLFDFIVGKKIEEL